MATAMDWVLLALALFGLIQGLAQVARLLRQSVGASRAASLSIIVLIRNQEQVIEGVVRHLISHGDTGRASAVITELILVDLGSMDNTGPILDRLQQQYPALRLVQLSADHAGTACDTAMFLTRGPLSLVLDLRYRVKPETLSRSLVWIWN